VAVHDSEAHRPRAHWRDAVPHLPAILAVGAVLLYAYLSTCYERFYGALGVSPSDVGLSYAGTLARSVGFVVLLIVIGMAVALMLAAEADGKSIRERWSTNVAWFTFFAGVFLLVGLVRPYQGAWTAANDVRAGRPVGPVLLSEEALPLPILAIHADPASVEPAGNPGDAPAAERLRGRKLLYLGQSNGTVVLYDATVQQAVYVPASAVILHVSNCSTRRSPDPACLQWRLS
jgi:hypothetical protein